MPVSLTVKTIGADVVRKGLEDLSREPPRIARKRIYEALKRVRATLKIPKSRPRYPIQWVSPRQQRAFRASNGFGRGIPTSRSGKSLNWTITNSGNGYTLANPVDYARYLYGGADRGGQSRIFDADYPLFVDVVENEITNLPTDIEEHLTYYMRQRFG